MKKRLLMVAAVVTGVLLQLHLPSWPLLGGMKPPVLTALVLFYATQRRARNMWPAVVLAAVLHDGLEPGRFGPAILGFPLVALLANRVRTEIFVEDPVVQMVLGAAGAMLATLVAAGVYGMNGQRPLGLGLVLIRIVGSGVLGLLVLPLVVFVMTRLEAALPRPRGYGWQ